MGISIKYKPLINTIIMSFLMGLTISMVFVLIIFGFNDNFFLRWAKSLMMRITIALPTALVVKPIVQKLTSLLVEEQ